SVAPALTVHNALTLHDALPIYDRACGHQRLRTNRPQLLPGRQAAWRGHRLRGGERPRLAGDDGAPPEVRLGDGRPAGQDHGDEEDRKSTRLNSSHVKISYAVYC